MDKNKSTDWFDKHCRGTEILFNIQYELGYYAESFRVVGNETIYQTLMAISKEVLKAHDMVRDAAGESIDESYKRSQQHTGTILKAVLAGNKLYQELPKPKNSEK